MARLQLTSLPLEILFYFGKWYDILFWILALLVFIYKGVRLPYPKHVYGLELSFLLLFVIIEPARVFLASKGNKTERSGPLVWSIVLAVPIIALHIFMLAAQTYVLKIDLFLYGTALAFCGLQVLLGSLTTLSFHNARRGP